jgi:tRNA threonylcarbamoyladenosine biosynthesis protein TsaE
MKIYTTNSEEETLKLAKNISSNFKGDEVVLLVGELGAGKTVFTKGIAAGLGLADHNRVCSPSYTLINLYKAKFPIIHVDLYRLENKADIFELGWEDYLGQGVIVIEWADKLDFNGPAIRVLIKVGENEQRVFRLDY